MDKTDPVPVHALFLNVAAEILCQTDMPGAVFKPRQLVITAIPANGTVAMGYAGKLSGPAHPVFENIGIEDFDGASDRCGCGKPAKAIEARRMGLDTAVFKRL